MAAMRCFYHTDREAVAICRMCSKGLCAECGESTGSGVACRGECAEWGQDYEGYLREALENYRKRTGSQRELDALRGEPPVTSIKLPLLPPKPPGPTMSERAAAHRQVAAPQSAPPALSPLQRSIGIFHLLIGCVLLFWGFIDLDRFVIIFLLGLGFAGFGVGLLAIVRPRPAASTTTVNV